MSRPPTRPAAPLVRALAAVALAVAPLSGDFAHTPEVIAVKAKPRGDTWDFAVTVRHDDSGWDHYANGWEVLSPDGERLGYRKLLHPHEHEQPFTRSLGGVEVPNKLDEVVIRAHCSVHGWTETRKRVLLEAP